MTSKGIYCAVGHTFVECDVEACPSERGCGEGCSHTTRAVRNHLPALIEATGVQSDDLLADGVQGPQVSGSVKHCAPWIRERATDVASVGCMTQQLGLELNYQGRKYYSRTQLNNSFQVLPN